LSKVTKIVNEMPAAGFIVEKWPCRGGPQQESWTPTPYRLGVDKGGGWRSPRKVTGQDNPQWPSDLPEIMVYRWVMA
jgi:hypothetical protein